MTDLNPVKYACVKCGGDDVEFSLWGSWDQVNQGWVIDEMSEVIPPICRSCGYEQANEVPVTDLKILAQIAINREQNKQKEETNDKCNAEHTDDAGYAAPC